MKWHRSPPVNLSGSGDNFKLHMSHVNLALIKKCVEAIRNGEREVVVRSTGKMTGECRYVEDAAERMVLATQRYNREAPANLGLGVEPRAGNSWSASPRP
jgi:GDP-L-fucose synthase